MTGLIRRVHEARPRARPSPPDYQASALQGAGRPAYHPAQCHQRGPIHLLAPLSGAAWVLDRSLEDRRHRGARVESDWDEGRQLPAVLTLDRDERKAVPARSPAGLRGALGILHRSAAASLTKMATPLSDRKRAWPELRGCDSSFKATS